jgi:acylphosphatase
VGSTVKAGSASKPPIYFGQAETAAMSASMPHRLTVYFSGHVQGVGFRYTTRSIAQRHPVTGYVRNLPDRRVELVAEGTPQEVAAFLDEVRERLSDHIRDERSDISPATGQFVTFEIQH